MDGEKSCFVAQGELQPPSPLNPPVKSLLSQNIVDSSFTHCKLLIFQTFVDGSFMDCQLLMSRNIVGSSLTHCQLMVPDRRQRGALSDILRRPKGVSVTVSVHCRAVSEGWLPSAARETAGASTSKLLSKFSWKKNTARELDSNQLSLTLDEQAKPYWYTDSQVMFNACIASHNTAWPEDFVS